MLAALALRVTRQAGINNSAVGRTVAGDGENVFNFRHAAHDCAYLVLDLSDVIRGRARRSLDNDREIALIFVGNETLGNALENRIGKPQSGKKQDHGGQAKAKESLQRAPVSFGDGGNHAINVAEEPAFRSVLAAEQERGKRGRESERVECGNRNRERNGESELPK